MSTKDITSQLEPFFTQISGLWPARQTGTQTRLNSNPSDSWGWTKTGSRRLIRRILFLDLVAGFALASSSQSSSSGLPSPTWLRHSTLRKLKTSLGKRLHLCQTIPILSGKCDIPYTSGPVTGQFFHRKPDKFPCVVTLRNANAARLIDQVRIESWNACVRAWGKVQHQ